MMLLHTLLAGGWMWLWLWSVRDSRVALGQGGAYVLLAGWTFVAILSAVSARRGPLSLAPWRGAMLTGLACILVAGVVLAAVDVGDGPMAVWIAGLMFGLPALWLGWAAERWLRPRMRPATRQAQLSPSSSVAALAPLLLPAVTILALGRLTLVDAWQSRIHALGLAGALYAALVPLVLPAALVVAWAHDRAAFGPRGAWHDAVGALAFAALLGACCVWPGLPAAMEDDPGAPAPARLVLSAVSTCSKTTVLAPYDVGRYRTSPFHLPDASGLASQGHPLAPFAAATAALALVSALLSAALVWCAVRGRAVPVWICAALVVLAWCVVSPAVARCGPAGAPGSVAGVAAVMLLAVPLLRSRAP